MGIFWRFLAGSPIALLVWLSPVLSSDWPQWRGPDRDGVSKEADAFATWPPVERWRISLTDFKSGYSSPVVSEGRVYLMGGKYAGYPSAREVVFCFDALTGALLWTGQDYLSSGSCGGGTCFDPRRPGGRNICGEQ